MATADYISVDSKMHFVYLDERQKEHITPVVYLAKVDSSLRHPVLSRSQQNDESKDAENETKNPWATRKIDLSILYDTNVSGSFQMEDSANFSRPPCSSDDYCAEEKVTNSPNIPFGLNGSHPTYDDSFGSVFEMEQNNSSSSAVDAPLVESISGSSMLDENVLKENNSQGDAPSTLYTHMVYSNKGSSCPTSPHSKSTILSSNQTRTPEAQHIGIPYVVRPRVYSAISSLEDNRNSLGSFQNKIILMGQERSKNSRRMSDISTYVSDTKALASIMETVKVETDANAHQNAFEQNLPAVDTSESHAIHEVVELKTDSNTDNAVSNSKHQIRQETAPVQAYPVKLQNNDKKKSKITFDSKPSQVHHVDAQPEPMELFRPSCDAYTPRMGHKIIKYKPAAERPSVEKMSTSMGTIQRPNFRDALRRVAMIIHQHILKIERRFEAGVLRSDEAGLFSLEMRKLFTEDNFLTPRFFVTVVNFPMTRPGFQYGMRKIKTVHKIPTVEEIYEFAHQLFKVVQLSSECSIVCLIYVERLMEIAKVPLMADTWRPIFMCGLLLASKVWQDLSSWNIEFASVYPQFSLSAINRLESQFLKMVKWDLYISSSLYAKYYFALRSLLEKRDFRQKYITLTAVEQIAASEAMKIQQRSTVVKEEVISELSRSM